MGNPSTTPGNSCSNVVVGCGNALAGDDAVGITIVRRLRSSQFSGARLHEAMDPAGELDSLLDDSNFVLLVDAVDAGALPGTIHLFPLTESTPVGTRASNAHAFSIDSVLALRHALGRRTPPVVVLGVQIAGSQMGAQMSPAVERAVHCIIRNFPEWLDAAQHAARDDFDVCDARPA